MAGLASKALRVAVGRALWEGKRQIRRGYRRIGVTGLVFIAAVAASGPIWLQWRHAGLRLEEAQHALQVAEAQNPALEQQNPGDVDVGRQRLQEFDQLLPAHDHIPDTLQDIFRLADTEGLTLQRGDYKVEPDDQGGFVRYRMTLPVKGDAQAIYRFIRSALEAHKTLALDSIQFRRERIESRDVEARIQWELLTRPREPGSDRGTPTGGQA